MERLEPYPLDEVLEMLSVDLAGFLGPNSSTLSTDDESHAYLTQKANYTSKAKKRHSSQFEKAKANASRVVREKDQLLERYTCEVRIGRKFLESKAGKTALEAAGAEAITKFKDFDKFEELVIDRAKGIYEHIVQDYCKLLHGTWRVSEEDLLLLCQGLPLNFTHDGAVISAGDSDDEAKGEVLPQA
ncbi:hypothetical protein CDL12_07595 [Handroanthus impetiginosus]|uniref:Uncharacterized protein n=1 Tax=Handroanthus impetiginosus TaxID=429701 RepID=A0A2G9HQB5_9LAMI|nr:hypothetical protein CDL12_07595 [Handroanthus impetiginosus]